MKTLRGEMPYLIILSGLPGSGKTTFGSKLSETFHAPFVDAKAFSDIVSGSHDQIALAEKLIEMWGNAKQTLIIEGVSGTRSERTRLTQLARQQGYQPLIVWFQINESIARQRAIRTRKNQKYGMSEHEYSAHVRNFSEPHESEHPIVVSGMHTYATQVRSLLKRVVTINERPSNATAPKLSVPQRRAGQSISVQ